MVKVFFIFCFFFGAPAFAMHSDFEKGEYLRPSLITLGVVTTTYVVSEMESGPALFAGLYAAGSLYLMNETYRSGDELDELILPFGLITLSVANAALFSDEDDFSNHDVFIYNLAGLGLLSAYAIWEHAQLTPGERRKRDGVSITPWLKNNGSGITLTKTF